MRTRQRTHVQNHAFGNKKRRAYVRDVHQLSNPDDLPDDLICDIAIYPDDATLYSKLHLIYETLWTGA